MLNLTTQQKLLIATQPVDFRSGIDALASLCKAVLKTDPFSGIVFAFTNKQKTAVKLLAYDGNGFWLIMKRFSSGKLAWWPSESNENLLQIQAVALRVLLEQGDPRFMGTPLPWRNHNEKALEKPYQAAI